MIYNQVARTSGPDVELRSLHQTLIHLRRTSPALIEGGFQILRCDENTLAYLRDVDTEQILAIGDHTYDGRPVTELFVRDGGIPDGVPFHEIFSGQSRFVQDGYLRLPGFRVGVPVWRSANSCKRVVSLVEPISTGKSLSMEEKVRTNLV